MHSHIYRIVNGLIMPHWISNLHYIPFNSPLTFMFSPSYKPSEGYFGGFPSHVWWPDVACGVSSNITFCSIDQPWFIYIIYLPTMVYLYLSIYQLWFFYVYLYTNYGLSIYIYTVYIYIPTIVYPHLSIIIQTMVYLCLSIFIIYLYLSIYLHTYIYMYYRVAIYIGMP